MFEKATRLKLRFDYRGSLSVEDLWDLSLRELDGIFKTLNSKKKEQSEESLLETRSTADEILDLKVEIIRHIVEIRMQEQRERDEAYKKAEKKQKILGLIAEKQDEKLRELTLEDLQKMVEGEE